MLRLHFKIFARDYLFFAILIFARVIKRVRPQSTINVFLMLLGLSRISLFEFEKCARSNVTKLTTGRRWGFRLFSGFHRSILISFPCKPIDKPINQNVARPYLQYRNRFIRPRHWRPHLYLIRSEARARCYKHFLRHTRLENVSNGEL